jgi:Glycosyl hydrolase catalytic core
MASKTTKRGICVPWNFSPEDFRLYADAMEKGKIGWCGNWEMWKPNGLPSGLAYVPQCRTSKEAGQIHDYLNGYASDAQVSHFLGFNEPDIDSQADMSVEQAVELWKAHVLTMKAKHHNIRVGSPGISNGPGGIPWLQKFFQQLGGIERSGVDFIAIHYYGPDVTHFKDYVTQVANTFKKPIWLTEFACTNWNPAAPISNEDVIKFLQESIQFLDSAQFVERYAWFGAMEDVGEAVGRSNGLQINGTLSEAGKIYTTL